MIIKSRGHREEFRVLGRVREGHRIGERQGLVGIRGLEARGGRGLGSQGDLRTDINRDKETVRLVPLDTK